MSQLTINLDGDALRDATTQAMLGILTPEARERILNQAVQALLKPSTDSWDKKKSPIEIAFENAVNRLANEEAVKMLKDDETFQTRLKDLVRQTADKVLSTDLDKMAQRMADAFVNSMRRD